MYQAVDNHWSFLKQLEGSGGVCMIGMLPVRSATRRKLAEALVEKTIYCAMSFVVVVFFKIRFEVTEVFMHQ